MLFNQYLIIDLILIYKILFFAPLISTDQEYNATNIVLFSTSQTVDILYVNDKKTKC